jgi:hypothetical protein
MIVKSSCGISILPNDINLTKSRRHLGRRAFVVNFNQGRTSSSGDTKDQRGVIAKFADVAERSGSNKGERDCWKKVANFHW